MSILVGKDYEQVLKVLDKIKFEFLPTSSFCEHALSNGWSDDYNKLADRFDVLYKILKNNY